MSESGKETTPKLNSVFVGKNYIYDNKKYEPHQSGAIRGGSSLPFLTLPVIILFSTVILYLLRSFFHICDGLGVGAFGCWGLGPVLWRLLGNFFAVWDL